MSHLQSAESCTVPCGGWYTPRSDPDGVFSQTDNQGMSVSVLLSKHLIYLSKCYIMGVLFSQMPWPSTSDRTLFAEDHSPIAFFVALFIRPYNGLVWGSPLNVRTFSTTLLYALCGDLVAQHYLYSIVSYLTLQVTLYPYYPYYTHILRTHACIVWADDNVTTQYPYANFTV